MHLEIRNVSAASGAILSVADVGRLILNCIRVATNFKGPNFHKWLSNYCTCFMKSDS